VVVPDTCVGLFSGHTQSVKCVAFVGPDMLASGGNDRAVLLWSLAQTGALPASSSAAAASQNLLPSFPLATLEGHKARVWDVASTEDARLLASVSADGAMKLWRTANPLQATCDDVDTQHQGDIYAVAIHPGQRHVVRVAWRLGDGLTPATCRPRAGWTRRPDSSTWRRARFCARSAATRPR
jgi:WD40 repeat protein